MHHASLSPPPQLATVVMFSDRICKAGNPSKDVSFAYATCRFLSLVVSLCIDHCVGCSLSCLLIWSDRDGDAEEREEGETETSDRASLFAEEFPFVLSSLDRNHLIQLKAINEFLRSSKRIVEQKLASQYIITVLLHTLLRLRDHLSYWSHC